MGAKKLTLMEQAFLIGMDEYDVKEVSGPKANKRIVEYLKSCDLPNSMQSTDETAWCSAFMNWCFQKAGGKGTRSAMARSWLKWGKKATSPRKGDVAVLKRGNDGVSGHVAFYLGEGPKYVYLYGGNQSNKVGVSKYLKSDVLDYRRSTDAV